MSAHLADRQLLAELIRLSEAVLSHPLGMFPHVGRLDLGMLADDVTAALRCPSSVSRIGAAEQMLVTALQAITSGGSATGVELVRYAHVAQQMLATVRDHYHAVVLAEARYRAAHAFRASREVGV